jgi:hypothetical protein
MISSAEASCLRDEPNWRTKPEYQLKSMAQTRASAKALRNVLAWVVVLAGYKPTPAEEMPSTSIEKPTQTVKPVKRAAIANEQEPVYNGSEPEIVPIQETTTSHSGFKCSDCMKPISQPEVTFSQKNYSMMLCRDCQKKYKRIV